MVEVLFGYEKQNLKVSTLFMENFNVRNTTHAWLFNMVQMISLLGVSSLTGKTTCKKTKPPFFSLDVRRNMSKIFNITILTDYYKATIQAKIQNKVSLRALSI